MNSFLDPRNESNFFRRAKFVNLGRDVTCGPILATHGNEQQNLLAWEVKLGNTRLLGASEQNVWLSEEERIATELRRFNDMTLYASQPRTNAEFKILIRFDIRHIVHPNIRTPRNSWLLLRGFYYYFWFVFDWQWRLR